MHRYLYVPIVTRVELTCGQPPEVSHATVKTTGSGYMDKATYTCATGYQSDGQQHALVCTKNATWDGDKIECTGNKASCNLHIVRSFSVAQTFNNKRIIICSYTYAHANTHTHIYIYTRTHTHTCTYAHMHTRTHAHTHTRTHAHTHTRKHSDTEAHKYMR